MKLTLQAGPGSTLISFADAEKFIGIDAINAGEKRLTTIHRGPWQICTKVIGLAVTATWKDIGITYNVVDTYTLHGERTISSPRQSGYEMGGYVSIDGKKRSCFTSSILFELPDGRLIDVGVIYTRSHNNDR